MRSSTGSSRSSFRSTNRPSASVLVSLPLYQVQNVDQRAFDRLAVDSRDAPGDLAALDRLRRRGLGGRTKRAGQQPHRHRRETITRIRVTPSIAYRGSPLITPSSFKMPRTASAQRS
jgi:hypothetical protein